MCCFQALGGSVLPGELSAELHESHLVSAAAALPLPHHLRSAWHAAVRRKVQLRRNADEEEHLRLVPSGSAHLLPGH